MDTKDPYSHLPDEIHPFKNFTPRQNVRKPLEAPSEEKFFLPDLTDDELRKLAREKLSKALQAIDAVSQPEMTRKLCAELMDRLDGKPGQAITMDATVRNITVNATVRFMNQPVVIEHDAIGGNGLQVIDSK